VRASDFLARYGGEEFVLLLPATALEGAARLADALRGRVARRRFLHEGRRIAMSMSFGVAQIAPGETPDEVLARADRALYVAKAAGRNRVRTAAA
jgi:diguanylate cyclase